MSHAVSAAMAYEQHLEVVHGLPPDEVELGGALLEQALWVADAVDMLPGRVHAPEVALTYHVLRGMEEGVGNLEVLDYGGRRAETRTGADWEWWIEGNRRWFHLLIQAKRLRIFGATPGYDLGHVVSGERQVDRLIRASDRQRVPALYVLYNPRGRSRDFCSRECRASEQCEPVTANKHGITVLDAAVAAHLVTDQTPRGSSVHDVPLKEVAPEAVPWSCLVGCFDECDVQLPDVGGARSVGRHSVEAWRVMEMEGEFDPTDAAFQIATTALALASRRADRSDFVSSLEKVLGGFTYEPPAYVLEPTISNLNRHVDELDEDAPEHIVVLRRSQAF